MSGYAEGYDWCSSVRVRARVLARNEIQLTINDGERGVKKALAKSRTRTDKAICATFNYSIISSLTFTLRE